MIVVIDNYDSFTYNLVQAFGRLGAPMEVRRNDSVGAAEIAAMQPSGIVISPGPGRPEDAGCCLDIIGRLGPTVPILGVCLGHQAIGAACGASVVRAPRVVHGKTDEVHHDGDGIFAGLPNPVTATRYHSLIVDAGGLPSDLRVTARSGDGLIMGMHHTTWPVHGVQFHPESIATPDGPALLLNFLRLCGEEVGAC